MNAKYDPYTCLERGTYPIYHDAVHFAQFVISKSDIFWVGFDENSLLVLQLSVNPLQYILKYGLHFRAIHK